MEPRLRWDVSEPCCFTRAMGTMGYSNGSCWGYWAPWVLIQTLHVLLLLSLKSGFSFLLKSLASMYESSLPSALRPFPLGLGREGQLDWWLLKICLPESLSQGLQGKGTRWVFGSVWLWSCAEPPIDVAASASWSPEPWVVTRTCLGPHRLHNVEDNLLEVSESGGKLTIRWQCQAWYSLPPASFPLLCVQRSLSLPGETSSHEQTPAQLPPDHGWV